MAELEFKKASPSDMDLAWSLYSQNPKEEKAAFAKSWNAGNTRIVTLDGEKIGWYACSPRDHELVIDHLHIAGGHRGMGSWVLNTIVMEATRKGEETLSPCSFKKSTSERFEKVWLSLPKTEAAVGFFKKEGFPISEESGRSKIDVSGILLHTHQGWKK